jgi:hypothetical protein
MIKWLLVAHRPTWHALKDFGRSLALVSFAVLVPVVEWLASRATAGDDENEIGSEDGPCRIDAENPLGRAQTLSTLLDYEMGEFRDRLRARDSFLGEYDLDSAYGWNFGWDTVGPESGRWSVGLFDPGSVSLPSTEQLIPAAGVRSGSDSPFFHGGELTVSIDLRTPAMEADPRSPSGC